MAIIGPIANSDSFFFIAIIALCLFLVLAQRIRSGSAAETELARMTAPERRKIVAGQRRERFWKMAASSVGLIIIILISADFVYSRVAKEVKPPVQLTFADNVVDVPVAQLKDHKLHHYQVEADGKEVRFIAIIDSSDTVRVGLDACQICGDQGYYQQGQNVICRNCGSAIYVPTIGSAGGCNPIHIDYVVQNNMLMISRAALDGAARYFH
jgi:uncharacterized membrane protein